MVCSSIFDFESTIEYLNPNDKWTAKAVNLFHINLHDRYAWGDESASEETAPTQSVEHTSVLRLTSKLLLLNWINLQLQYGVLFSRIYLPSGDKDLYTQLGLENRTAARRTIEFSPIARTTEKNWFELFKNAILSILFVSEWRAISSSDGPKINGRHHDVH